MNGEGPSPPPQSSDVRAIVVELAARLVLTEGIGAVTLKRIHAETGIGTVRLGRYYRSNGDVLTELRSEGHRRVSAVCVPAPRGTPTTHLAAAFSRRVIEQAAADPVARAVHCFEMFPPAGASDLASIYDVWTMWLQRSLTSPTASADERVRIEEVVAVLVAVLAGMCQGPRYGTALAPAARAARLALVSNAIGAALAPLSNRTVRPISNTEA